jgi:hypothetical protein
VLADLIVDLGRVHVAVEACGVVLVALGGVVLWCSVDLFDTAVTEVNEEEHSQNIWLEGFDWIFILSLESLCSISCCV